ncbi:MAG: adenine-specific methylase, partial [Sedimentibacter sp.]|nr:adenine-specific methylase [Sedimentibacter sp.]
MDKLLLKMISSLIKDLDNRDYIADVRYIIYLVSKVLYCCKTSGLEILGKDIHSFKATTQLFSSNNKNIFSEYKQFDLKYENIEDKVFTIIASNKNSINSDNFRPAELYETLLTSKEKKNLGQVYTPIDIIDNMLNQLFELKKLSKDLKILDPSCGGGYFLIEAFIKIKKALNNEIDDKYIIENMLYGVDIDEFSIFLTKAGIIFASKCSDVNFNIFNLDYLTDAINLDKFDIIVGNPPYVGHKNSSMEYKKILYETYSDVFYDKADISYCFFEKSHKLLKTDGIISFITSRYFMEALYADRMRTYIKNNFDLISLIDFSGKTVFKDAMVSPAIITLLNKFGNKNTFSYVKYTNNTLTDKFAYKQDKLKNTGWIILKDADEQLFNRIDEISNTFIKDICTIRQGIITGLDKAFIVDEETVEKYEIESNLLKKWIKNSNITKASIKYNNLYLIYTNIIDCEQNYPNAINYLTFYKDRLQNRRECVKGYRKWYELQWGRAQSDFENPKIVFPYKASNNNFYYDENKYFCSADIYFINNINRKIPLNYFLTYLNSDIFEFYFKCRTKKVGSNIYDYYPNKLNISKVFLPQENILQNISDLGKISIEKY